MADDVKKGYGGRPLWQWILIYLVVGGAIYFLVYYFVLSKNGGYSAPTNGYNYGAGSGQTPSTESAPYKY